MGRLLLSTGWLIFKPNKEVRQKHVVSGVEKVKLRRRRTDLKVAQPIRQLV
jgi:hypothetical protein